MHELTKRLVLVILTLALFSACSNDGYRITDVKIYKNTPAWELAKAVNNQNTKKIAEIVDKTPESLDYQDPVHGMTLLFWAVGMEKYEAAEALLKAGADPDIISTYEGGTALYRAASFSFIDNQAKKDPKFVKLLLMYGADPNIGYVGNTRNNTPEIGTTPLMQSIGCGFEKTKALVEAGADINFTLENGHNDVLQALWLGRRSKSAEPMQYAYFLIVEKKANVTIPLLTVSDEKVSPVTNLRDWIPPLDSEGYKIKMEIVEEFARQGVDYWSTEINKGTLEQIQYSYPDTWEEYIKVY